MTKQLLTPEDVADRMQVKAKTVREWLRNGVIKGSKIGRLWRIKESDLEALIKRGRSA